MVRNKLIDIVILNMSETNIDFNELCYILPRGVPLYKRNYFKGCYNRYMPVFVLSEDLEDYKNEYAFKNKKRKTYNIKTKKQLLNTYM